MCDRNIDFIRFDTDSDTENVKVAFDLAVPQIIFQDDGFYPEDIKNIWFRRPRPIKLNIKGDEAELVNAAGEWSEAIEGFLAHIPLNRWMNHPSRNTCASHKMEQITRAKQFGLSIPKTLVTQNPEKLKQFWTECNGQVIVKPLASGYLERKEEDEDSLIYTNQVTEGRMLDLTNLRYCPTFFQEMISKRFDVRICIVDEEIHAIGLYAKEQNGQQRLDIRRNNMSDVCYVPLDIPNDTKINLFRMIRSYELRFAAVDMAVDQNNNWIFFEINPNGQWAWLDLMKVSNIADSFIHSFSCH